MHEPFTSGCQRRHVTVCSKANVVCTCADRRPVATVIIVMPAVYYSA